MVYFLFDQWLTQNYSKLAVVGYGYCCLKEWPPLHIFVHVLCSESISGDDRTLSCAGSLRCTEWTEIMTVQSPEVLLCCWPPFHRHTASLSLKLRSVCQVVNNPDGCGGIHLCSLELLTEQCRLNCIKSTGEIKAGRWWYLLPNYIPYAL